MSTSAPILATTSLTKHYGKTLALDSLDLELPEGGLFGFLGPNGSGKTTTIRLLLGLLRPTSGGARILGRDCWRESARVKREVGYLPGDVRLYGSLDGRRFLRMVGHARGLDLRARAESLAERLDLDLTVKVARMSKGMRQKLGIVLALAHEPRLLVLDEPTSGLDPIMQDVLKDILRELASRGHTVFFSSHTLSEVEQLCDRVAILRRGRVVVDTTLDDLRARAGRHVRIEWRGDGGEPPHDGPPGLDVTERRERAWLCRWRGPVEPLVRWLASGSPVPVEDVVISPPDLESLFREYYQA